MISSLAAGLLHRGIEAGKGYNLIDPLEAFQRQQLGKDARPEEWADAGDAIQIPQVIALAPGEHDDLLQCFTSPDDEGRYRERGNAAIFLEIMFMSHVVARGLAKFPVVPHECFLLCHLLGLDKTVSVSLRSEKRELSGIQGVGLALSYGQAGYLLGVQWIRDLDEEPLVREGSRRSPMVRTG